MNIVILAKNRGGAPTPPVNPNAWDNLELVYTGNTIALGSCSGVYLSPDGTELFYLTGSTIKQRTLSTPWDISTESETNNETVSANDLFLSEDGTKMYIVYWTVVTEYTLSTPFDLSTLSSTNTLVVSNGKNGIYVSPDGLKMLLSDQVTDAVYEYTMSVAFDLSTATETRSISVLTECVNPQAISFKTDGTIMYVGKLSAMRVWNLSTPWDISTAVYDSAQDDTPALVGMFWSLDGDYFLQAYAAGVFEFEIPSV